MKRIAYAIGNESTATAGVSAKAEIAENIWEVEDENSSNLIEVYVNYLRKKVDKGFSSKLIHTQFGMGYILRQE